MAKFEASDSLSLMIQKNAEQYPDLPVFTFENDPYPDEWLTFSQLEQRGNRLAVHMINMGIKPGDSVAVVMKNHPEAILALYATSLIGAVLVPLDPQSNWEKIGYFLRNSEAKGVLFSVDVNDMMNKVLKALPNIKVLGVRVRNHPEHEISDAYPELDKVLDRVDMSVKRDLKSANLKGLMIIYTPGTTGIPKGVVIDQNRLFQHMAISRDAWQYLPSDKLYTGLSLAYGNTWTVTVLPALQMAIPAVISREYPGERIWDICRRYRCTTFACYGRWLAELYSKPERPLDGENPVRKIIASGTPRQIWTAFEKRFCVKIHEWYATQEGGFAHNPPEAGPVGSFGKPHQGSFEMKVIREDGHGCEPGETGELVFRPKPAYSQVAHHKSPGAAQPQTEQHWQRTGDLVHMDDNGWLFYDSRKLNRFKYQGEFVLAREIEEVMIEYPQVCEVVIFGAKTGATLPDEKIPVAAIKPGYGNSLDIQAIFDYCEVRLSPTNRPVYIQVVEEIPRTGTAKILHRRLSSDFSTDAPNVYYANDYLSLKIKTWNSNKFVSY